MKLEDLLMQPGEDHKQIKQLDQEVKKLQKELDDELQVNRVLKCAMQGPVGCCESCSSLSTLLPFKVQVLLGELADVEEEIDWLERKVNELKLDIDQEKNHIREWEQIHIKGLHPQRQLKKLPPRRPNQIDNPDSQTFSKSQNYEYSSINRGSRERRASLGSSMELWAASSPKIYGGTGKETEDSRCSKSRMITIRPDRVNESTDPNKLSVEVVKCLIGIFLNLNKGTKKNKGSSANLSQNTMTCMNSKDTVFKGTFSCKTPPIPFNHNASHPYGNSTETDSLNDAGPYKNYVQISRSSLDATRLSECFSEMKKLRVLMQKLGRINITHFNHKQKLAFWINIYNACVMHAFLQHGLPSTEENLLALINEAEINIGGAIHTVYNIKHFILRHPTELTNELPDEKEIVLRHTCGLNYPEPNIIFALCRGSWSSPALRYYTPDDIMNELEKAKVDYLEASVKITSKKKVLVPQLMEWHMKDFADDVESLVEWIYSQLSYKSSLKRRIMECLDGETQCPPQKLIEIQPYVTEFRYLVPL